MQTPLSPAAAAPPSPPAARRSGPASDASPSAEGLAAWRLGFTSLEVEHVAPVPLEVRGALPPDLQGTLLRNGPGRLDIHGDRLQHWFDGDGMVHAVTLANGRATYRNRFVATPGKLHEDAARRRIYAGFGTRAAGGPLARLLTSRRRSKNPANTHVVTHAGRLLALCEGGRPFALDPDTLATLGEDTLDGLLGEASLYSAHPRLDPATGELWNIGVVYGRRPAVRLYATSAQGKSRLVADFAVPHMAMIHDFALTPTRAVVVVAPTVLPPTPLALLFGQRSFGESLRYRPELGVSIAVVDRASGAVRWHEADPFLFFHVVNAFDDGDDVVVDLCAYHDDAVLRLVADVVRTDAPRPPPPADVFVERLTISPTGRARRERRADVVLEFPRVADRSLLRPHEVVYGVTFSPEASFLGQPVALDVATGHARRAPLGPGEIAGECVPVPKPGARDDRDAWLLTLVLDPARRVTDLRVLDAARIDEPPVAVVTLPHVVPLGFHGSWAPAA